MAQTEEVEIRRKDGSVFILKSKVAKKARRLMCPVLQQTSRLKIFSTLLVNPGSANNLKQSDVGF